MVNQSKEDPHLGRMRGSKGEKRKNKTECSRVVISTPRTRKQEKPIIKDFRIPVVVYRCMIASYNELALWALCTHYNTYPRNVLLISFIASL